MFMQKNIMIKISCEMK